MQIMQIIYVHVYIQGIMPAYVTISVIFLFAYLLFIDVKNIFP